MCHHYETDRLREYELVDEPVDESEDADPELDAPDEEPDLDDLEEERDREDEETDPVVPPADDD